MSRSYNIHVGLGLTYPYRYLYVTHAALALQSHELSGEGIKLWITYILFDHTRTWRASPDEWSARCRGHLRDSTNMKDNTHQAHTQSSQQGEYEMITTAKWYSGTLGGLKFPDICLTGEENPEKTSPRKLVPTGDRTRAPCVTCYHLLHSGGHRCFAYYYYYNECM